MGKVVEQNFEHVLEFLRVTGVKDKLQKDVRPGLELLGNAGIEIWILTADTVEVARRVASSAKLVSRGEYMHTIAKCIPTPLFYFFWAILTRVRLGIVVKRKDDTYGAFEFLRNKTDSFLLIDGESRALPIHEQIQVHTFRRTTPGGYRLTRPPPQKM